MAKWLEMTRDEIDAAAGSGVVVVLPVGAVEQHGSHLPTGTDSMLAERVVEAAVRSTNDVALPAITYGCSLGHTDRWPGTVSLSVHTLIEMVNDIGRWVYASGFRKLVLVNAHATNGPPCQSSLLTLRHEHPDMHTCFVSLYDIRPQGGDGYFGDASDPHANEAETSMLMHLTPEVVRLDLAVDEIDRSVGRVLTYSMPAITRSGVVGTPTSATSQAGEVLFAGIVEGIVEILTRARRETDPMATDVVPTPSTQTPSTQRKEER